MVEPSNGLVISYNYLWAREYDRHEEFWSQGEARLRPNHHRT